jgi:beta-galactosidase
MMNIFDMGMLHGADYNYEQWLDRQDILDADLAFMKKAGTNVMSIGIFSWSMIEKEEGRCDFDWLDGLFDRLHKNGQKIILATPSGARPAWLSGKYPEVCRMSVDGIRRRHGGRHNHCRTSKKYREACVNINARLAERYGKRPGLILWHVSNEYNGAPCYCPSCISAFHTWLKERYASLDALNAAWYTAFWSHCFTSWEQIYPEDPSIHGLMLDWQRFTSEATIDFFLEETAPLRRLTPEIPITTNFQMPDVGLDYHDFARHVDIVSWDNYPEWHRYADDTATAAKAAFFHDLHRSYKNQPFLMMESSPGATSWQGVSKKKKAGVHLLSSIQAVAHGSNSVQYFQWRQSRGGAEKFHDAVISHFGKDDTPIFRDVCEVSAVLKKLAPFFAPQEAPDTEYGAASRAAVIYDYQNGWALNNAELPRNREKNYQEECINHYRTFWTLGIQCDVIDSVYASFDRYKLIVMPMLYMLRETSAEKIRDFIRRGGIAAATYLTGIVNGADLCYLGGTPGNLTDVFGLAVESTDVIADYETRTIAMNGKVFPATHYADRIRLNGASPLAVFQPPSPEELPALTVHEYGKGKACYLAARTGPEFLHEFFGTLCKDHGIYPCVPWEIPRGVSVQKRGGVIFVMNFMEKARGLSFNGIRYYNILNQTVLPDIITIPPYGAVIMQKNEQL